MGQKTENENAKMIYTLEKLKNELIELVKAGLQEFGSESDNKGPASLIFAYEGI